MLQSTFFNLPPESNRDDAAFWIVPVPYEGTVCFMKGTANAPAAILKVSDQMEDFDEETHASVLQHGIATLPPIPPADTPEEEFQRIYETVKGRKEHNNNFFGKGHFPIFLGGEHSITPPIVKVADDCLRHFGHQTGNNVSVLQFDAHADLRDFFTGGKYSHASAMRRVLEYTPNLVQVGIRSYSAEEYEECPDRINAVITPQQIRADLNGSVKRIIDRLRHFVYITIDIDAF
ncbi:MAG: arginase family protein, partial [Planctomycetaceae bacterium]|nr:arginase family protein [Planctomycetaceae bacterium]